ncbi:hypothetical protein CSUI_008698 [Cystoisospora suis]|uniref:Transmembrane protein n=1 Tax=Cystoisospora suis TaxID=483139 RepID=A0A2C6K7X3_9APIC|nr:hypothetical protein CSUI_008698 [Cystoisospora suis]
MWGFPSLSKSLDHFLFFFLLLVFCILPSLVDSPYYLFSQSFYSYSSFYRSFFLFSHVVLCVLQSHAFVPLSLLFSFSFSFSSFLFLFLFLFLFFFLLWGVSRP